MCVFVDGRFVRVVYFAVFSAFFNSIFFFGCLLDAVFDRHAYG